MHAQEPVGHWTDLMSTARRVCDATAAGDMANDARRAAKDFLDRVEIEAKEEMGCRPMLRRLRALCDAADQCALHSARLAVLDILEDIEDGAPVETRPPCPGCGAAAGALHHRLTSAARAAEGSSTGGNGPSPPSLKDCLTPRSSGERSQPDQAAAVDTPFRSEALIAASRGLESALNEFGRQADHLDAILSQAERDRDALRTTRLELADLRAELTATQANRDAAQARVRELEAELHRERTAAQKAAYDAEQAIAALRADLAAARAAQRGL